MVDVSTVLDADDGDFVGVVIDAVEHPVGSAAGGPDALKFSTKHRADAAGLLTRGPVMNSITAAATASGRAVWMARIAGGVRTNS